jgi:uncharacterized protein with GYD domain
LRAFPRGVRTVALEELAGSRASHSARALIFSSSHRITRSADLDSQQAGAHALAHAQITSCEGVGYAQVFEASCTAEGAKGLLKDGDSGRRAAVEQLVKGLGGKVEAVYFAFGEVDAYVIADVPDAVSAVASSLAPTRPASCTSRRPC